MDGRTSRRLIDLVRGQSDVLTRWPVARVHIRWRSLRAPIPASWWTVESFHGRASFPVWSKTRELLYGALIKSETSRIMVVRNSEHDDAFRADKPSVWSPTSYRFGGATPTFELHPDGQRVVVKPVAEPIAAKHDQVVFIFSFFDELRRIAPGAKR